MNDGWPELPSEQYGPWGRFYMSLGVLSVVNLIFGLVSHLIKTQLFLSEALVAILVGIGCGPKGLDLLFSDYGGSNLNELARLFYHASRVVMAIQIMAAGVSLPRSYVFRHWQSLIIILGPVMLGMWLISSIIFFLVFSKFLSLKEAFLLGACVTPTDPVLANSIIKGRFAEQHVPIHLRTLLSAESGANDGAALPFLTLPLLLLLGKSGGEALKIWLVHVWLYQIILSVLIGTLVGFGARKALQYAEYKGFIDKDSFLVFSLALAMSLMGLVTIVGSSDLLAIFTAGVVFAWDDWFLEATKEARIQEVVDSVFNLTFFVFLGTAVPWDLFPAISLWRLCLGSLLILLFRRVPVIFFLRHWIPELKSRRESLFAGWFGPMGVGAIFYACLVTIDWNNAYILPIVWFIVLSSIVAHGVTVPLFHLTLTRTLSLSRPPSPSRNTTRSTLLVPPPSLEQEIQGIAEALGEARQHSGFFSEKVCK